MRILASTSIILSLAVGPIYSDEALFEGGESVTHQLRYERSEASLYDYIPFPGYFEHKKDIEKAHDLSYGFNAYLLPQGSSQGLTGENSAFSGVYRFAASWTAVGSETGNPGRIEIRIENRSAFGNSLSPTELASELGISALNSGFIYSDGFSTDYSVLNWTQVFTERRFGFAIGRLAFDAYQDTYFGQTISGNLINRAFVVNPAIATTGVGALGAVARGFVTDNVWLGAQIYDANAKNGDFDMDTFDQGEWLTNFEAGWTPEISRYKIDRIALTYWSMDQRVEAGIPPGNGWALTASRQFNHQLSAFGRFGYSNGGGGVTARRAASLGFKYAYTRAQTLGVGLGWADPADSNLDDEFVLETGYNIAVTPQLSVLPDLQVVLDPANNPDKDHVWIFSMRAIFAF